MPHGLGDYQAKTQEDTNVDFTPINGAYICRIDKIQNLVGESKKDGKPYDFYSLSTQVIETVEGEAATNRYLNLNFTNDVEGLGKLSDSLFTAGIELNLGLEGTEWEMALEGCKDKTCKIRAWTPNKVKKVGDDWVEVEPHVKVQRIKVVKEFNLKGLQKPSEATKLEEKEVSELPF